MRVPTAAAPTALALAVAASTSTVGSSFAIPGLTPPPPPSTSRRMPNLPSSARPCVLPVRGAGRPDPLSAGVRLAASGGGGGIQRPENEFSRTYRADSILGHGGLNREYRTHIEADEGERAALAERFRLSDIARLEADLVLRSDDKRGAAYKADCIQVEGTVQAAVTQKCVRTNEDFDVDLEFDVISLVKAVESSYGSSGGDLGGMDAAEIERQLSGGGGGGGSKKKKRKGKKGRRDTKSVRGGGGDIDAAGVRALQDMLRDFDAEVEEEDVVEDEAVLGSDGVLDLGELVAQLFRLKLDPYPKKPGSKPINISFSG